MLFEQCNVLRRGNRLDQDMADASVVRVNGILGLEQVVFGV